ncbi:TetR/AcrR family transcriptional regulator [Propionibacteriaceae bacterium G1746]
MARPARFSPDDIMDAASAAVLEHGRGATLAQVAQALGGPTGSIYHRFASRDELMAALWLRSIRRFHVGLMAAYTLPDPQEALLAATRHIPMHCREHPADAMAMTLHRQPVLASSGPVSLRDEARMINDEVDAAMRDLVVARYGEDSDDGFRLVMLATRMCPFGMVRPFVGGEVPQWLDETCVAAAEGILGLGDR